jgi:hypothetical protein
VLLYSANGVNQVKMTAHNRSFDQQFDRISAFHLSLTLIFFVRTVASAQVANPAEAFSSADLEFTKDDLEAAPVAI